MGRCHSDMKIVQLNIAVLGFREIWRWDAYTPSVTKTLYMGVILGNSVSADMTVDLAFTVTYIPVKIPVALFTNMVKH